MKRLLLFLFPVLLLAGCGGGSSGGGPNFVGVYIGSATFILNAGGQSQTITGRIQFTVNPDYTVDTSDPGGPIVGTGPLNGNTFVIIIAAGPFFQQATCTGTLNVNGTISGNTMTGTFSSGNLVCNGVRVTISGNFNATLQPSASLAFPGNGLFQGLDDAIIRQ